MTAMQLIIANLNLWISSVAATIVAGLERLFQPRRVIVVEDDHGTFSLRSEEPASSPQQSSRFRMADGGPISANVAAKLAASRVELHLQACRFLFRPLELPGRAAELLDGIVRAQIDRLTPWTVRDAAFGWSGAKPISGDRFALTIAATARTLIAPYIQAIADSGAHSIAVFTLPQGGAEDPQPIKVLEQSGRGALDLVSVRRALAAIGIGAGAAAVVATIAAMTVGSYFDGRREDVLQSVSELRSTLRAGRDTAGGAAAAQRVLERRKREHPSTVLVLEALSRVLPDGTYVTDLRIEGDKLQIVGSSRDAPSLIRLLEQSPQFVRAAFFAPTTRSAGENADQFHIEVTLQPVFAPGS